MATTARPPSVMQGRPETASRIQSALPRPGTASRLAAQTALTGSSRSETTARPGTGRGPGTASSRALQSGRGKPAKNARDRAYLIGALRSKITDITNETNKLNGACNSFEALKESSGAFRAEHSSLSQTVSGLRGNQYDYEAMLESVAKGVTNDDIQAETEELRQQNDELMAEVQDLLNDRQRRETQLKKLQDKAKKYEASGEALLKEMSAEDQLRYREMQNQLLQQTDQEDRLLTEYEQVKNGEHIRLEEELVFYPLKKEAGQVLVRIRELQTTLEDIKMQVNRTPEQEQVRLVEKVKICNNEIATLERQSQTLKGVLETMRQQADGATGSSGRLENINLEKQQFLSTFAEEKNMATSELSKAENENIRLLDQLCLGITALNDLPISTEADLLKSGQQLRTTVGQVKHEQRLREDLLQMNLEECTRELKKLDNLFGTLVTEKRQRLSELSKREASQKTSASGATLAKQDQDLQQQLNTFTIKQQQLTEAVSKQAADLEEKQKLLKVNAIHQNIVAVETRLQQTEARTYDLQEVIAESVADTIYADIKDRVLEKVKHVNEVLQRLALLESNALQE